MEISSNRTHRLLFALALTGALMWPVSTGPLAGGNHDDQGRPDWEIKLCFEACSIFEELCPDTCDDICGADVECSEFCLPACSEFADMCRDDCKALADDDDDGNGNGNDDDDDGGKHNGHGNGGKGHDNKGNRVRGGR